MDEHVVKNGDVITVYKGLKKEFSRESYIKELDDAIAKYELEYGKLVDAMQKKLADLRAKRDAFKQS